MEEIEVSEVSDEQKKIFYDAFISGFSKNNNRSIEIARTQIQLLGPEVAFSKFVEAGVENGCHFPQQVLEIIYNAYLWIYKLSKDNN